MEKVAAFERGKTNHALFPIEIFQAQGGDLAGAHTQAGGHQHDGEVPFSARCLAVDAIQHPEHLRREQSPRSASKPVVRGRAQRCGPIAIEMTQAEKVTEQATQFGRQKPVEEARTVRLRRENGRWIISAID